MTVALGFKAHSGWAALVAVGVDGGGLHLVDRRRVELVAPDDASWAKQPYHSAEPLKPPAARALVARGVAAARRMARHQVRQAVERVSGSGHEASACAVLMGDPMPDWSVDEILAVHFRMHKAEGDLFRDALARAAQSCGLRLVGVPAKQLEAEAVRAMGAPAARLRQTLAALGKPAGPPWGGDQKEAALAALIALRWRPSRR